MKENPKFKGIVLDENDKEIPGSEFVAWHSRSVAVTVIVCDESRQFYLLEQRGPGCPDNIGKWAMPCGYVNWDETLKEAAVREVFEETGLRITTDNLKFYGYDDALDSNRQNITMRFICELPADKLMCAMCNGEISCNTLERGGEDGECSEIKLFDRATILNPEYQFAFNHKSLILKTFSKTNDNDYDK